MDLEGRHYIGPAQETSEAETGGVVMAALEQMNVFSGNSPETNVMSVSAPVLERSIPESEGISVVYRNLDGNSLG